jgi:hypothetical protein
VPAASFLVGLRFAAGEAGAANLHEFKSATGVGIAEEDPGTSRVVFREHPGALRLGDLSTDGDVLATHGNGGAQDLLAVNATNVWMGTEVKFRASSRVTIALRTTAAGCEANLNTSSPAQIEVRTPAPASVVRLDGARVKYDFRDGMTIVQIGGKGEHLVEVVH